MKTFIKLILVFLLYILVSNNTYSYTWDIKKNKTIIESKKYINQLKEKELNLKEKWNTFIKENWKITSFLITPLSESNIKSLEDILEIYYKDKKEIDRKLLINNNSEEKKEILKIKIKLYKKIVPYIDKKKIKEYLKYIKSNIDIFEKNKTIKKEILIEEKKLNEKVLIIKEKIIKHRKELNDNLRKVIVKKLNEKIKKIKENPKFINLNTKRKIELFTLTLKKLSKKKEDLYNMKEQTTIIKKKLEIYEIAIEIIEKVITQITEKSKIQ